MTEPIKVNIKAGVESGVFILDDGQTLLMVQAIGGSVIVHERPVNDPSEGASSGGIYSDETWDKMVATVAHQRAKAASASKVKPEGSQ